ncbi:hypothetical protein [Haloechinothrix sp. LS1_15]|uniref:hypothetical protein n=1 Tax=Haloechinothrix sp. LS1_15 TaxID=2652248 RepID=UPI00294423AB|nr:hypothetical protein [Haloechinothrix sp. LS1_15]MDV6013018.1 hypothetical protein [Haloechinothrix sp. LS1_15]
MTVAGRHVALLLVLPAAVLGGCGLAITGSAEPAAPDLGMIAGTWEGSYVCPQGPQGMSVTVDAAGERGEAIVEFYEVAGNPGVGEGSYAASVEVNGDGSVVFTPQRWIEHPDGYEMVPLVIGDVVRPGMTELSGAVDAPGCEGVWLERQ